MGRKTRIAFIAHDCSLFGAQRSLLSLLLNLDRNKFDPIVIIPYEGPFADIVRKANIPCHTAKMSRWIRTAIEKKGLYVLRFLISAPRRIYHLWKLLNSLHVDIVYTNTIVNIDGALAAKLLGKKHIWHLREGVRGNKQLSSCFPVSFIPGIIRFLSDQIIVNSQWLNIHSFGRKSSGKIVYNGINPSTFSTFYGSENDIRRDLGIPDTSQLIVSIGSIDPRKGHDIFIKASEFICRESDNVYGLIVGGGETVYENYLRGLIQQRRLHNKVFFLGWRNDVPLIIAQCDALVLASEQEPFGRVLIEAMALKKPIVATKSGGPEEIVVDGETGYLVPVHDPAAMANSIMMLLSNKDLCAKMGIAGYNRMLRFFSEEAYVTALERIIADVASN